MLHDHSKLEPFLEKIDASCDEKNYNSFIQNVQSCIVEFQKHLRWENSEKGVLHEIEVDHPELSEHIIELRNDHLFLLRKLEKSIELAKSKNEQAFVLFERFKIRRKEHVFHEDELDVMIHTIKLNETI